MPYKKFVKDFGFAVVANLITSASGIITVPLIIKILDVRNYGIWTQLFVTMVFISTFATLNLPYALTRFLPGEKDKREIQDGIWSVFAIVLGISIVISAALMIFADPVARFFESPKIFVQILAIILIFEYVSQVFSNTFRAFQQNIKINILFTLQKLGEVALIIAAVYAGFGLLGALLSVLIIKAAGFLLMGADIIRQIGFSLPKFRKTKQYLSFSAPTVADTISGWAINSSDRYLVQIYLGTLFVGYYASAYTIGTFAINFLATPFGFLLPAILSKHYDENKTGDVKNYLRYSLKYFLLLAIPAVFGLSALSKQIMTILTTPESAGIGYLAMPIVALSMIPMGINAIIAQIISMAKKTKVGSTITTISAILNIGLNIVFIPWFGIIGAAITTLIAFTFTCAVTWIYSFRHVSFPIEWKFILKTVLASSIMAAFVFLLSPAGLYGVLAAVFAGVLIYGILIIAMKGFSEKEFSMLRSIISTR